MQVYLDISQEDKEFLETLAQKERDRILKEKEHEDRIKEEQKRIEIENIRRSEEHRREKERQEEFKKSLQAGAIPSIIAATSSNKEALDAIWAFIHEQEARHEAINEKTIKIIEDSTQITDEQKVELLTNMKSHNQSILGTTSGQLAATQIDSAIEKKSLDSWEDAKEEIAPKQYDEGFGE